MSDWEDRIVVISIVNKLLDWKLKGIVDEIVKGGNDCERDEIEHKLDWRTLYGAYHHTDDFTKNYLGHLHQARQKGDQPVTEPIVVIKRVFHNLTPVACFVH